MIPPRPATATGVFLSAVPPLPSRPSGPGETSKPGRMVAGANVVSVDAYALQVARFGGRNLKPADVPHIKLAAKAGLGEANIAKLKVEKVST